MPANYLHGVQVIEKVSAARPIRTVNTAVIGIVGTAPDADPAAFPLDVPVLIAGDRTLAGKLDTTGQGRGTLPAAMDAIFNQIAPLIVVVRVAEVRLASGAIDQAATQSNVIGTVTATGKHTGLQALLVAETITGVRPRILGAPGFSHAPGVAAALEAVANRLRAFAYVDLAAASPSAAITARSAHGAKRTMLLWPKIKAWSTAANAAVDVPASAFALGLRAKLDNDVGWHKSLSNAVITGAIGISQPVDWALQDPNSTANLLNANEITTIIRQGGFRFWGNRTPATDPVWAFEVAVRTGDVLADSIAEAHLWAMDKPMSKQLFEEIVEGVNAKFRELKAQGYIVDGKAWLDQDLNTKTSLAAGKLWIDYEYTPVPPLENLNFNATITDRYLLELVGGK